ncbi:hypothetical protein H0H81_002038 [Sphagnurus paluster]|uniref:Ricin B lectin domain-containing protein n=1 Tax=Sphagnurus paluster TaxID=117069 RepID=A0A9P7K6M5_9AGAR|nr:hypothetical protein H0H81_002038 [Sphagnurus paluster]
MGVLAPRPAHLNRLHFISVISTITPSPVCSEKLWCVVVEHQRGSGRGGVWDNGQSQDERVEGVKSGANTGTAQSFEGEDKDWVLDNVYDQWTFKNVGTGRYLEVAGPTGDGTPLIAVDGPVSWDIWPDDVDSSVYRIFVPNTPFNVDLSDHGNPSNGTRVTLWSKWQGTNQTWRFLDGE